MMTPMPTRAMPKTGSLHLKARDNSQDAQSSPRTGPPPASVHTAGRFSRRVYNKSNNAYSSLARKLAHAASPG
jgi:hypothetical protein